MQLLPRGTINAIARECNRSHSAVSSWFQGRNLPNIKNALIIEQKFNIPVEAWLNINSYLQSLQENNITKQKAIKSPIEGDLRATEAHQTKNEDK